jgi:hypothetical protein
MLGTLAFVTVFYFSSSWIEVKQSKQCVMLPDVSRADCRSSDVADWKPETIAVLLMYTNLILSCFMICDVHLISGSKVSIGRKSYAKFKCRSSVCWMIIRFGYKGLNAFLEGRDLTSLLLDNLLLTQVSSGICNMHVIYRMWILDHCVYLHLVIFVAISCETHVIFSLATVTIIIYVWF